MLAAGRKLATLRDATNHITGLLKKEAALPEWQAAIEALMLVVEQRGPKMSARIGVMRALNRGQVREFNPSREEHHRGGESSRGTYEVLLAHGYPRLDPVCDCRRHSDGNDPNRFSELT
ncbi:hypothetical protein [Bradyrhizobium algeriense]|uniref:hypothetical protein n=1 Tax=Bradyrhizobium algeriense TaxID=634784 RepID=UPI0030845F07